jgi:Leucine-rich repeat (LRR) protein
MSLSDDEATHESDAISIDPFDGQADEPQVPQSQGGVLAALQKSKAQTAKLQTVGPGEKKESLKCKSCNMDSEFVPDGMISCERCRKVHYCSSDCMQWHWKHGGHARDCEGNRGAKMSLSDDEATHESDAISIDPFDGQADEPQVPQSQGGVLAALQKSKAQTAKIQSAGPGKKKESLKCKSCNMDSEFVPDGMISCERCQKVHYCSSDCMQWHWKHGGHARDCEGSRGIRAVVSEDEDSHESDLASIDPFENQSEQQIAPQTQGGVLAALRKSKTQTAQSKSIPSSQQSHVKCAACNIDSEFVPEGMLRCEGCGKVQYCSSDCQQWHWKLHKGVCIRDKGPQDDPMDRPQSFSDDDVSIEGFDPNQEQAPQSSAGVMAAVHASRAETISQNQPKLPGTLTCVACGMDSEFVSEGMKNCPKCNKVSYCSLDCMEWHWNSGGHRSSCRGVSDYDPQKGKAVARPVESDDMSIEAFEPGGDKPQPPQSSGGVLAAVRASKAEAAKRKTSEPALSVKCQACGMEEEFVPEGMMQCPKCLKVPYCSTDCMEWDWNSGGHKDNCEGHQEAGVLSKTSGSQQASTSSRPHAGQCEACGMDAEFVSEGLLTCEGCGKVQYCSSDCQQWHWKLHKGVCIRDKGPQDDPMDRPQSFSDDDVSIEAFDPNQEQAPQSSAGVMAAVHASRAETISQNQPKLPGTLKCVACGMDSEFVSEGMKNCPKCNKVSYCSLDCMEWHWNSGGHRSSCRGVSDYDPQKGKAVARPVESDDMSIEAFEPGGDKPQPPQSSGGVLAAVRASKAEAASRKTSEPALSVKCQACGMEEEFVPEGMMQCPKCLKVPYCSTDCMEWDWNSGGHKDNCEGHQEAGVLSKTSGSQQASTSSRPHAGQCEACGMDAEFVSEGLLTCEGCGKVQYCSSDCQQWHWRLHKDVCRSGKGPQDDPTQLLQSFPDDDVSIEAFDPNQEQAAQSSGGVMAAVRASKKQLEQPSRESVAAAKSHSIAKEMKAPEPPGSPWTTARLIPCHPIDSFDDEATQQPTERFQGYREYLVAAVSEVRPLVNRIGSSILSASYFAEHPTDDSDDMDALERGDKQGYSSSSDSTSLLDIPSSDDEDNIQLEEQMNNYLSKNVSGATPAEPKHISSSALQLAAPTDDGELPTYRQTLSLPTSVTKKENNTANKAGREVTILTASSHVKPNGAPVVAPPSDIESGDLAHEPTSSGAEESSKIQEIALKRKTSRRRCIIINALVIIAAICIAGGLSWHFLREDTDDQPTPETPSPSAPPAPTIPSFPPSTSPATPTLPPVETVPPQQQLFEFLVSSSFDDGEALGVEDSPQAQAYEWLVNDPGLPGYSAAKIIQRYALSTFYFSTGGDAWVENTLWLSEEDECSWFTRSASFPLCEAGEIVTLEMDFNNLSGSLPPELALLTKLERVELSGGPDAFLSGSLPSELGILSSLDSFSVRGNQMSGTIPSDLGNWTWLRTLNLSLNRFSGRLSSELGQMARLSEIFMGSNELTGPLPAEIGQATGLFRLSLGDNNLSGGLPTEIGLLPELRYIYMETNQVSSLPSEIGLLSNLIVIAMFENSLSGPLPSEIGGLIELRSLLLSKNSLTSTIPTEIGLLGNQLGKLKLGA